MDDIIRSMGSGLWSVNERTFEEIAYGEGCKLKKIISMFRVRNKKPTLKSHSPEFNEIRKLISKSDVDDDEAVNKELFLDDDEAINKELSPDDSPDVIEAASGEETEPVGEAEAIDWPDVVDGEDDKTHEAEHESLFGCDDAGEYDKTHDAEYENVFGGDNADDTKDNVDNLCGMFDGVEDVWNMLVPSGVQDDTKSAEVPIRMQAI